VYDHEQQAYFYYNSKSGDITWDAPRIINTQHMDDTLPVEEIGAKRCSTPYALSCWCSASHARAR
jgi:hypothetical protein